MEASNHKYLIPLLLTGLLLTFGCRSKTVCPEETKTVAGEIISLSGQQDIRTGEQAVITMGVRNSSLLCVKEAHASYKNQGLDTLLVSAELSYIDDITSNDCDCKRDSVIYTLLYFTPLNSGTYHFITKGDSSISNAPSSDRLDFVIVAD